MPARMGIREGDLILEVGLGDGCDFVLRDYICAITGTELLNSDSQEVVDSVIIWWRNWSGDLADELMDSLRYLDQKGAIWVLTLKVNRDGHVEPSEITDAASIAGLSQTSTISIAPDWMATRLVARKTGRQ